MSTPGRILPLRFLMLAGPSTAGALVMAAGIFTGALEVKIASAEPIGIASTHGTAQNLVVGAGADTAATGTAVAGEYRGVALVHLTDGRLDDLCLMPRFGLPAVPGRLTIKLSSASAVHLGEVTLAVDSAGVGQLDTRRTVVGAGPGAGAPKQQFEIATETGERAVEIREFGLETFGLTLDEGLDLRTLAVRVGVGDQPCTIEEES